MARRFLIAASGEMLPHLVKTTSTLHDVEIAGTADSSREVASACARLQPDVAVIDISLLEDEESLAELHRGAPETSVVVVVARLGADPGADPSRLLAWGASGIVYRDASAAELLTVFDQAARLTELTGDRVAGKLLAAYADAVTEKRARDLATIQTLAAAVEFKDATTAQHLHRVTDLAAECLAEIDADLAANEAITYGFTLHDIGKIGVPDAVLTKAGPLTDVEWTIMRKHPEMGAEIVRPLGFPDKTLEIILHHHERFDGKGYPAGLAGSDIPLAARVFAISDAFDAMTSDRPYRKAMPAEVALGILVEEQGRQFDPDGVSVFVERNSTTKRSNAHPLEADRLRN